MSDLIKIAVDAMGGDGSPKKIIDGIIHNHKSNCENFFKIFGDKNEIENYIKNKIDKDFYEIVNTNKVVKSTDSPLEAAKKGKYILGICLGMQLLSDWGEEGGGSEGLGLIPGEAKRMPEEKDLLLPHVGWNTVEFVKNHPVFRDVKNGIDCYFAHSYHFVCNSDRNIYALSNYGTNFISVIGQDNVLGFQFHPESISTKMGMKLIKNFIAN